MGLKDLSFPKKGLSENLAGGFDNYKYIDYIYVYGEFVGNVLISLDREHEAFLRRLAQEEGKKGAISGVVEQALDKLNAERQERNIKERLKKRLLTGIDFKYKMYNARSEIYD